MKTCFAIMPFDDSFKDIEQIISAVAKEHQLEFIRGDFSKKAGLIMAQVIYEINRADVIVADITGHNPNVFYELGIAHYIKPAERVVILCQDKKKEERPFDVAAHRHFVYKHNEEGREKLKTELRKIIKEALDSGFDKEYWNVIKGSLPRTEMIIKDLKNLIETKEKEELKNTEIRIVASLSSIAISDKEPEDPVLGIDYHKALIRERNALLTVLSKGASVKAVLNPPYRFAQSMNPVRLKLRYERLIGLLEGHSDIASDAPINAAGDVRIIKKRCQFVLSPVPTPNLFIIGDDVAYEGIKRGGSGGFEMTHCEVSSHSVKILNEKFDKFFEDSKEEMEHIYSAKMSLADILRSFYNEAISFMKK